MRHLTRDTAAEHVVVVSIQERLATSVDRKFKITPLLLYQS